MFFQFLSRLKPSKQLFFFIFHFYYQNNIVCVLIKTKRQNPIIFSFSSPSPFSSIIFLISSFRPSLIPYLFLSPSSSLIDERLLEKLSFCLTTMTHSVWCLETSNIYFWFHLETSMKKASEKKAKFCSFVNLSMHPKSLENHQPQRKFKVVAFFNLKNT